jgi:hypothetical protein
MSRFFFSSLILLSTRPFFTWTIAQSLLGSTIKPSPPGFDSGHLITQFTHSSLDRRIASLSTYFCLCIARVLRRLQLHSLHISETTSMARCPECSKVMIVVSKPQRLRMWTSLEEMASLAQKGCHLCAYLMRGKNLENPRREKDIRLDYDGQHLIFVYDLMTIKWSISPNCTKRKGSDPGPYASAGFRAFLDQSWPEKRPDPIVQACKLFRTCFNNDDNAHNNCGTSHTEKTSVGPDSLPKRLLDLSHGDKILTINVPMWIRLGHATVAELSNYCTLSYRWGTGSSECMLETAFIEQRAMSLSQMPQTFKDAIKVARALDTRFLWIDALCIIQPSVHGDYADWKAEGPRMNIVYQNSRFTISATCSEHPADGFLSRCGIDLIGNVLCDVPILEEDKPPRLLFLLPARKPSFSESVVESHLNNRGWVAQERALSRRLLHFTEGGVFWECYATNAYLTSDEFGNGHTFGDIEPVSLGHASLMDLRSWMRFIELYSGSKFTHPTDRLIALSSIAKAVPIEEFGNEYYAGIWRKNLVDGLMWYSTEPSVGASRALRLSIAPSWSWASVASRVDYYALGRGQSRRVNTWIEVQDVQVSFTQANNPYGDLNSGKLRLLARLCNLSLSTDIGARGKRWVKGNWDLYEVFWDEVQDLSVTERLYTVIPVGLYLRGNAYTYRALVVEKVPQIGATEKRGGSCIEYRRIGFLLYHPWWQGMERPNLFDKFEPGGDNYVEAVSLTESFFPHTPTPQTVVLV